MKIEQEYKIEKGIVEVEQKKTKSPMKETQEISNVQEGYRVTTIHPDHCNAQTIVKFEVSYHDWLKLENSSQWKDFVKLLEEYQIRHNQHC